MKAEWPGLALVKYAAVGTYQIKAVGPTRIGILYLVVEAIHHGREFNSQSAHTRAGYRCAFFFVARTPEEHVIAHVALHLPHVRGVCLKDIDCIEIDFILVLSGQFVQGGNLPPKRRSRITPEYQDDRFAGP